MIYIVCVVKLLDIYINGIFHVVYLPIPNLNTMG